MRYLRRLAVVLTGLALAATPLAATANTGDLPPPHAVSHSANSASKSATASESATTEEGTDSQYGGDSVGDGVSDQGGDSPESADNLAQLTPDNSATNVKSTHDVTYDLQVSWDVSAPAKSPPGDQLLAYFVVTANDVDFGTAGLTDFTVIIEGTNAGFASWAHGNISDGGRTLTIPFSEFQLATSERFGFGLIGDQQGEMGAIIRLFDDVGDLITEAKLAPRPVLPGVKAWDVVLGQTQRITGDIQSYTTHLEMNLTIDRTSPIPDGYLIFDVYFDDVNPESAQIPASGRHTAEFVLDQRFTVPPLTTFSDFVSTDIGRIGLVETYATATANGWQLRIPTDGFNPFADVPRVGGSALDPDMRIFATLVLRFSSVTERVWQDSIHFAANIGNATWGGVPETDRGVEVIVGARPTINNRVAFIMTPPLGSFTSTWHTQFPGHLIASALWGVNGPWEPTASLQNNTARLHPQWSAGDFLPAASEVSSVASISGIGTGYLAAMTAIQPTVTPFQGRVIVTQYGSSVDTSLARLYATRASVGDLTGVEPSGLGGWFAVPRSGEHGDMVMFELPNPATVTAVRAFGRSQMTIHAMHYTRMASPTEAGWMIGRGWWPQTANIADFYRMTGNQGGVVTPTPGQLFPSTNGSRDVLFGNYGFPRIVKSVTNQAPGLGEQVTFTIRAVNVSNGGQMELVVYDQMDERLQFVPGSVRVNGLAAPDPVVSESIPATFVPDATVRELRFDLGYRPVNQIFTIEYYAVARWDVGTVINSAWMEPTEQARQHGFTGINANNGTLAQVSLHRQLTGNMELTKTVARDFMGPNIGHLAGTVSAQNAWLLSVLNGTSQPALSTAIDIFPFYGDGRGTTSNVTHQMTSVASDHPVIVYYTMADPATIDPDPSASANTNPGLAGSIWTRLAAVPAGGQHDWSGSQQPTALLLTTAEPIASGAQVQYEIGFTAQTLVGEQGTFVNYAWQRDNANHLRLVRAATTVSEFPEITVSKTIDGLSLVGVQPDTEQLVTFELTNTGTEPLTNITFVDETVVGIPVEQISFAGLVLTADGYLADTVSGQLVTLAPGETVTATGILPGLSLGERHVNVAHVTAVGVHTGDYVRDDDPLQVETVGVHISKDILNPDNGRVVNGIVYLDIDPETGFTAQQTVTFTITNLSSEGLRNLVFADRLIAGQAISEVSFAADIVQSTDVQDDVVRVVFEPNFVLEPGAAITGTGALAPMAAGERHHNAASVWGTGVDTDTPTEDGTDQPADPGQPGTPGTPGGPDAPVPPRVPDNELIADTVGIRIQKFIAGAPVNADGHPILEADRATGIIPAQEITFRVTNPGSEALTNLVFTDITLELPSLSSVTFPSVPSAVVIPQGDDWRVEFGGFVLEPGQVVYGIGTLPALEGEGIKHHNVASITGEGVNSSRIVHDVDNLIIDPADLEITKTVSSTDGEFRAGGQVFWTITVTNHGPDRAVNIKITDRLLDPASAAITSARFTQAPEGRATWLRHNNAGVDAWLDYLISGETAVIVVDGQLAGNLQAGDVVANVATVSSATGDPNPDNNTDTAELVVGERPKPPAPPVDAPPVEAPRVANPPEFTLTGAELRLGLLAIGLLIGATVLFAARRTRQPGEPTIS